MLPQSCRRLIDVRGYETGTGEVDVYLEWPSLKDVGVGKSCVPLLIWHGLPSVVMQRSALCY